MSRLILAEAIAADDDVRHLLRLAAALLAGSDHALADAVRDYAEALGIACVPAAERRFVLGRVHARIDGDRFDLMPLGASDAVPAALRRRWTLAGHQVWIVRRDGAEPLLIGLFAAEAVGGAGNFGARLAVSAAAAQ